MFVLITGTGLQGVKHDMSELIECMEVHVHVQTFRLQTDKRFSRAFERKKVDCQYFRCTQEIPVLVGCSRILPFRKCQDPLNHLISSQ